MFSLATFSNQSAASRGSRACGCGCEASPAAARCPAHRTCIDTNILTSQTPQAPTNQSVFFSAALLFFLILAQVTRASAVTTPRNADDIRVDANLGYPGHRASVPGGPFEEGDGVHGQRADGYPGARSGPRGLSAFQGEQLLQHQQPQQQQHQPQQAYVSQPPPQHAPPVAAPPAAVLPATAPATAPAPATVGEPGSAADVDKDECLSLIGGQLERLQHYKRECAAQTATVARLEAELTQLRTTADAAGMLGLLASE